MREYRLIALCWLIAATAHAWDPSWSNGDRFAGYIIGNEANTAAMERCYAARGFVPHTDYFWSDWFKQRTKLVNAKANLRYVVGDYVDVSAIPSCVFLTELSVLTRAGAPTNYFDETPWFALNTSSNGWMFIPAICSQMVCTAEAYSYYGEGNEWYGFGTGTNWAQMKSETEGDWQYYPEAYESFGRYTFAVAAAPYALAVNIGDKWSVTFDTHCSHSAAVWLRVDPVDVFSQQGCNVSTNLAVYTNQAETTAASLTVEIGKGGISTNDPGFPEWCAEPATDDVSGRGWTLDLTSPVMFIRWDGPNGFRYK